MDEQAVDREGTPTTAVGRPSDTSMDRPRAEMAGQAMTLVDVAVRFGSFTAVQNVTMPLAARRITALIGPSGCGKTTVLRSLNRMHDRTGGVVSGQVMLGQTDVYGPGTQAENIRSRIGMVFQRPNPFSTMSILDNVTSGLRFIGVKDKKVLKEAAESALRHAALWDTVKTRLDEPAIKLSGGQQQRLCIARALAVEPEVLLMDEPCSALDPVSTAQIEELIVSLSADVSIALVTHNMFQANRVSDFTAMMLLGDTGVGELIEFGPTGQIFESPQDPRTEAYVTGKVG